jgi:enediyne biosynthesis protein E4
MSKNLMIYILSFTIISTTAFCMGFVDVTDQTGVTGTGIGNGIAFVDYDNDGKLDLYVSSDPNDILYHNNGDGTYEDVTDVVGISFIGDGVGVVFGDYNNDGYLDLYVPVNDGPDVFFQNEGGKFFRDVTKNVRIDNPARARSAAFADFDNDGFVDVYVVNENSQNILYRNVSGRFFEDVTQVMNVARSGPGRGCIWGDYDNDGDPDLFVTNKGAANVLFRNDGAGFKDVTNISGLGEAGDSTGAVFADYDNDGYLDLCFGGNRRVFLYHNNHDSTFLDVTDSAGLAISGERCSPAFCDYDNDGDLDLYLAVWMGISVLYENNGDGTFTDVTDNAGTGIFGNSWSAISGDYNNDGAMDIYTSFTTRSNVLYENKGNANNWIKVKIVGSMSNRDAIGTRLKLTANGTTQIREVNAGNGYGSQDSSIIQFGIGEKIKVDMLEVTWPSGISVKLKDMQPNRLVVLEENLSAVETPCVKYPVSSDKKNLPDRSCLQNIYPNPFNPETWIPYQLAQLSDVEILIYDSTGGLVKTLRLGIKNPGYYTSKVNAAYWDGTNENGELVSSGVYFCQLKTNNGVDIKKMILKK